MRPRINTKFGKLSKKELFSHLYDNYVHGITVKRTPNDTLEYMFLMMFRNTRQQPEELYVKISGISKLVIDAWTNKRQFETKEQLIKYTTK